MTPPSFSCTACVCGTAMSTSVMTIEQIVMRNESHTVFTDECQTTECNRRQAMKANVERWRGVAAWMGLVCLVLLPASSLSAQEPKLRATLKGHTGAIAGLAS